MNDNIEKLKRDLEGIDILPNQNWADRTFDELKIIEKDVTSTSTFRNKLQEVFYFLEYNIMATSRKIMVSLITLIILTISTTTLALASDAAVPGDILYPVDKAFENISRSFKFSDESKVEYEQARLLERLNEYQELSSPESKSDTEDIDNSLEEVKEQIAELDSLMEELTVMLDAGDLTQEEYNSLVDGLTQIRTDLEVFLDTPDTFNEDFFEELIENLTHNLDKNKIEAENEDESNDTNENENEGDDESNEANEHEEENENENEGEDESKDANEHEDENENENDDDSEHESENGDEDEEGVENNN